MDKSTRQEIQGRTIKLEAQEQVKSTLDTLELRLNRLYNQTHETINGRKVKLTKMRKISKANVMIDKALEVDVDISVDAINQLKIIG